MVSSLQIFITVLVLYVAVVNYMVVRSLTPPPVVVVRPALVLPPTTVATAAPATTPAPGCYDETVYVAVMVPPTALVRENSANTLLASLRRAEHPLSKVHMLLVGSRASALYTHRQWCTMDSPSMPCSALEMEDTDARALFRRVLAEFECIQDLVVLGVNSRVSTSFFELLHLAPRDMVTCLSTHSAPCQAFRVSARYMQQHLHGTDIAAGAQAAGMYFGAQPVLAS